jgi:hypothetical protein
MRQTFAGVLDRARKVERASLLERLSPDIGSEKLTAMLAIQLLEVICVGVKLSVRLYAVKHASSESVNTMLFIDTLKYAALGLRNALVIRWVVAAHRTGPNAQAFVPKNMFYDTTLGTQSEIALEVFAMFALGSVMQSMSFSQLVDGGTCSFVDPDHTSRALSSYYLNVNINDLSSEGLCVDQCVGVGTVFDVRAGAWPQGSVAPCDATVDFSVDKVVAQAAWAGAAYGGVATGIFVYFGQLIQFVNYITLVAVFAPLDNAHQGIKTLCQLMQVGMFVELVYDILLHIVYSTGDSQVCVFLIVYYYWYCLTMSTTGEAALPRVSHNRRRTAVLLRRRGWYMAGTAAQ